MLRYFSPGVWFVVSLAAISSAIVAWLPVEPRPGIIFWVFDRNHAATTRLIAAEWNKNHSELPVQVTLITGAALTSRMMTGFYSDTPVGDMIEVERSLIGQVFAGPMKDIGFVDLTDRLKQEGLDQIINPPSFSPWTSRGRIFGLPHDVHPVMLMYRADLAEAAGIDVSQIETWDDYFRTFRPLMQDLDGDGRFDRYLLNAAPTSLQFHEVLMLQAGGGYFDVDGNPTLNSAINVKTLAHLATWYAGPARVTSEIPTSGTGPQLIADGYCVGFLAPDWYAGTIRNSLPTMAGKFKLMPLPAWEPGGRRTSVFGGTMLGITRASEHTDAAWEFAKELYLSPTTARQLYEIARIITPIKSNWAEPFYDEPDAFFCNQAIGRAYIKLAPDVPLRPSSPFYGNAQQALNIAIIDLSRHADENAISDPAALMTESRRLLDHAQQQVIAQMQRNVFLKASTP